MRRHQDDHLAGTQATASYLYLFDYGDEWRSRVRVHVIDENADPDARYPRLVESVGEAPPQYPDRDDEEGWWRVDSPTLETRYAIVQGIDVAAGAMMHVFALDSQKHTAVEFLLRAADWLPSERAARDLGGRRTPVVYTIVSSGDDVKRFDHRLRQVIQRLSGLVAAGKLRQFEKELARYVVAAEAASLVTDELMLSLMVRTTFPSPLEMRYPTSTMMQRQDRIALGFWAVTTPQEERRQRPQVERLLTAWLNL